MPLEQLADCWPSETKSWANHYAEEIRKRYGYRKIDLAVGVYETLNMPYGFHNTLLSGTWLPWPHEAAEELDEVNCQTSASIVYVVAKALGLQPTLYLLEGLHQNKELSVESTHFLTTAQCDGEQVIIDPVQLLFGQYSREQSGFRITRQHGIGLARQIQFNSIAKISEEQYCEKVKYLRIAGKRNVLTNGQLLTRDLPCNSWLSNGSWRAAWYIRLCDDTLESTIFCDNPLIQSRFLTMYTPISEDSKKPVFHAGYVTQHNFMSVQDQKILVKIPYESLETILHQITEMTRERQKEMRSLLQVRLHHSEIFKDVFTEKKESNNLLAQLDNLSRIAFDEFKKRATNDELVMVVVEAAYQRARCEKKARTVFSFKDHRAVVLQECARWHQKEKECIQLTYEEYLMENELQDTPFNDPLARITLANGRDVLIAKNTATHLAELYKNQQGYRFEEVVDRYLFATQLKNIPTASEFSNDELLAAYAGMLMEFLVIANRARENLLFKQELPVIRQALAQI